MTIAIDCRSVSGSGNGEMAGIAHYTWHLVRHLLALDDENRYVLFYDTKIGKERVHDMLGANHKAEARPLPFSRFKRYLPFAYSHRLVASAIQAADADVTHFPSGSQPMGFHGKSVLTVHDLAIYAHPEWFPDRQDFSRRVVVPASVRRATRIIAVSQATKQELQRLFGTPEQHVRVIHEGADAPADVKGRTTDDPYFLFLGTVEPRKNVRGLAEAYATLAKTFPKLVGATKLAIAGAKGWKSDETFARIDALNEGFPAPGPHIDVLGYLPAEEKHRLMARALALVFPSFDEGFGLPVVEAMTHGTPVIISNRGALPEVAAHAAITVDPTHKTELVLALKHLLENSASRAAWGRKAIERSLEFSWDRAAGETLEVYRAAAKMT